MMSHLFFIGKERGTADSECFGLSDMDCHNASAFSIAYALDVRARDNFAGQPHERTPTGRTCARVC